MENRIAFLFRVVANYLPALHDKFYALELCDVTQRVACNGDDVRKLSLLNRADAILPSHHLGGDGSGGLNGLRGCHAILYEEGEFSRLHSVRKGPGAAPEGNFDSSRYRQSSALFAQCSEATLPARRLSIP